MKILLIVYLLGHPSHSAALSSEDFIVLTESSPTSIYNDYTEARYHEVLNRFTAIMEEDVKARGGTLHIQRDWGDGAVNAWAWREGSEFWLEVPGGASRYYLINEEAFLATLCHELGHLLGGAPASDYKISYEGQSDYYSTSKCLPKVLREIEPFRALTPPEEVKTACALWPTSVEQTVCERSLLGALSLTSYYASLEKSPFPLLSTPSTEVARSTLKRHPPAQCRFDTFVAGALCQTSYLTGFSYDDPAVGSCHRSHDPVHGRPRCWYAEAD